MSIHHRSSTFGLLSVAIALAACSMDVAPIESTTAAVRVINATAVPLNILIDGRSALLGLAAANVSPNLPVTPGAHSVRLESASAASADVPVQATAGATQTTVAYSATASGITANVLVDTGSIVPAGKSKLRVIHLAAGAPALEIWRTQPDFPTPVHIMTPFLYQGVSPYLQSDPGAWEVWITAPNSTTKLVTTGPITVPNGERRTVILLDSAGVMRFKVTPD